LVNWDFLINEQVQISMTSDGDDGDNGYVRNTC
jgi:hypothetical protein